MSLDDACIEILMRVMRLIELGEEFNFRLVNIKKPIKLAF